MKNIQNMWYTIAGFVRKTPNPRQIDDTLIELSAMIDKHFALDREINISTLKVLFNSKIVGRVPVPEDFGHFPNSTSATRREAYSEAKDKTDLLNETIDQLREHIQHKIEALTEHYKKISGKQEALLLIPAFEHQSGNTDYLSAYRSWKKNSSELHFIKNMDITTATFKVILQQNKDSMIGSREKMVANNLPTSDINSFLDETARQLIILGHIRNKLDLPQKSILEMSAGHP